MIFVSLLTLKCYFLNREAVTSKMPNLDDKSLQLKRKVRLYIFTHWLSSKVKACPESVALGLKINSLFFSSSSLKLIE